MNDMAKKPQLRSECPLAGALDILGDKWTLLVLRDLLFFGAETFKQLEQSPEGISTNTLSNRLQRLEELGIIAKKPYQENPVRYKYMVTKKGKDLGPMMQAAVTWGQKHVPGTFQGKKPPPRNWD